MKKDLDRKLLVCGTIKQVDEVSNLAVFLIKPIVCACGSYPVHPKILQILLQTNNRYRLTDNC